MELTHEDVMRILDVVAGAELEYFELRLGDTVIVAARSDPPLGLSPTSAQPPVAPTGAADALPSVPPQAQAPPAPAPPAVASPAPAPAASGTGPVMEITAPMVGVFYRAPEPGAAPFVQVGDSVEEGATIGLIEVMKMFNAVTAPAPGTVTEILVGDGDFVEFGQTLAHLDTPA